MRRARRLRRAYRVCLHRQSLERATAARGPDGGADRQRSGQAAGVGISGDEDRQPLPDSARRSGRRSRLAARPGDARRQSSARSFDPRIVQVRAGYSEELRHILVAASDGTYASDVQPLSRLNVFVIAKDGAKSARGTSGGGGRVRYRILPDREDAGALCA